jgi:hypothetical protein
MSASHPLVSGFQAPPPIQARLTLNALPGNGCFETFEDFRKWLESAMIEFVVRSGSVVYGTAGTVEAATNPDRDKVRLMFDDEGRCFGFATYSPEAKAWVRSGVPGELLTVFRTETTVVRDMEIKLLRNGWLLCDGTVTGAPNLVGSMPGPNEGDPPSYADNDFFRRPEGGGEWTVYTVIKVL